MKIAVDAMGGDFAPAVVIEAVATALKELPDVEILLVGNLPKIQYHLEKARLKESPRLSFVHAEEVVEMGEPSTNAVRSKKHSSITVCAELVKSGKADGIVSAGHTGAAVAATKVRLRMVPGVDRPALAALLPAIGGKFILVDAGANTDCEPLNLAQFAVMGEIYSQIFLGIENPRVGLLSVGGEDVKGNALTKETFKILSKMPINFIGNVEGHDLFNLGADVVVCDGFSGNVVLKSVESISHAIGYWLKEALMKNVFRKAGAVLAQNAFKELKNVSNYEEYGGAPLLGISKPVIKAHGSSDAKAIKNAIRQAITFHNSGMIDVIATKLAKAEEQ